MRFRRASLLILGALGMWACGLFDVTQPSVVDASRLNDPTFAGPLVQGAIGDFECAFGNYVAASANLTDEFYGSVGIINSGWDLRLTGSQTGGAGTCATARTTPVAGTYGPLQTARFQADDTYARLQAIDSSATPFPKTLYLATLAVYAGYTYTLFGEGYCSSAFDLGPKLTPAQVLDTADKRFTQALALATSLNNVELMNFARVGRARVRLDQRRYPEAAADARLVTEGFVKNATFSSDIPRRLNQVYMWNNAILWATIDPRFRNLTVDGVPDPRVPVSDGGRNGVDRITRLWVQMKYPSETSPIPIASWEEAQLIVAEAEGGQSAVFRINLLRTKKGLPAFASTDSATIAQQVAEERRRQLFLDGHRLGDFLRDDIPNTLQFDSGKNTRNEAYGDMTCLPLPNVETDNNPNLH